MEALTKEQKQALDNILSIKSNYKKDPESRKNTTYIHTRLNRLENLWAQFISRDISIQNLRGTNVDHPYFTNNFFENSEKQYEDIKDLLQSKLVEVEEKEKLQQTNTSKSSGLESTSTTSNGEYDSKERAVRLLRIQTELMKLVQRLIQAVKTEADQAQSREYYKQKLNTIQTYWDKIVINHTDIVANPDDTYQGYLEENRFQTLEDSYENAIILMQEKLNNSKRKEEDIKLPNLILPVFDGDYHSWISFRDIYVRLIHNNSRLGAAEKMQYLKTHLAKDANSLLQHLNISDANYETAWQLLNERFDNKRKICSSLLQRFLSQPKLEQESANEIRKLHDTTKRCLHAISNMGIDTTTWSPFICHIIIQKLDSESHKLYEQSLEHPRELPTCEGMFSFLETRFQSLESLKDTKKKELNTGSGKYKTVRASEQFRYNSYHTTMTNQHKCSYCQQSHKVYQCQKFIRLSTQDKRQFVQMKKLCTNCLAHKDNEECHSKHRCNICQHRHHTLLHQPAELNKAAAIQKTVQCSTARTQQAENIPSRVPTKKQQQVILATALIKAKTSHGHTELLRALIDQGSQASFISEEAAELLALPRFRTKAEVSGLGLTKAGSVRHKLLVEVSPRFPSQFSTTIEALVLPHLTRKLPDHKVVEADERIKWNNIILADPTYDTPGPINIIIGADVFRNIMGNQVQKYENGLYGQQTEFGWVLAGPIECSNTQNISITSLVSYKELDQTLKNFWELENPEYYSPPSSEDDKFCEQHFVQTHTRNQDGSYTVRIPFKDNKEQLGESRRKAMARLLQNEKKFMSNKQLEKDYKNFMQEYIALKHMIPVTPGSLTAKGYYLPHQAIIKEDSSTTKLRVVFDASATSSTGVSLNDTMHAGPKLQNDITDIIVKWRKHRYVFTADIEKMYRQIKIHSADQNHLKVLWRSSPQEPVQEFHLNTVTYGTTAAPFLAIRTLHQLAQDEKETHPRASQVLKTDFYVDDLLTGTNSLREAKALQKELISLLASGGFKLRKWTTNQQTLLQDLPEDLKEKTALQIHDGESVKTLGLHWSPASDTFKFQVHLLETVSPPTKRMVLSDIARLFDPAGWLSPVIIRAKIFMQELWVRSLDWDSPLPSDLALKWDHFKKELPAVQNITIPRWIHYTTYSQSIELHGFCDASEKAFAAVIYTKVLTEQGEHKITMVTSKTKVAPIKKQATLPRLELCSAVLLAKLIARVKKALDVQVTATHAWTDSQITLAWIQGESKKWDTFIASRVSEIRSHTATSDWHHVKSEDNPADCASRGITPSQLKIHPLWWTGPAWLKSPTDRLAAIKPENTAKSNQNLPLLCNATIAPAANHIQANEIFSRFSNYTRMVRVLTYCHRFIHAARRLPNHNTGPLQTQELHYTTVKCIKMVQHQVFQQEIAAISQDKQISKSSKLFSLAPFMDNDGLLRLGGRLSNSLLAFDQKYPIILPHSHRFTTLVIRNAHRTLLHGSHKATLTYIRQKYWIIDAKTAVRAEIHRCLICCRYQSNTSQQMMGSLPAQRVRPSKPFTHTGIDYAGPFQIRMSKGRGTKSYKGYIAVYVCLSTKAIHLEAVSDLTTEAFLASYKRFTARRGQCTDMYSDCGTTFIGARNTMEKQFHEVIRQTHKQASHQLPIHGTTWHFIPPASPHFGGLWEAGVKSTKYHLKRIAGDTNWTFEEFSTLLAQIEACLNSRPLCPLSNDPDELEVLTPGHFLVGRPLIVPPEPAPKEPTMHCLTRWKLINKMQHDFWKVWSSEYLSRLQQRTKWQDKKENVKIGDMVLLKEDHLPPSHWALGRIEATHPGNDGLVRVVTIKTARNLLKRPITKICKLPFETNELPTPEACAYTTENPSVNLTTTSFRSQKPNRKRADSLRINPTNIPVRPSIEELRQSSLPPKRLKLSSTLFLLTCVFITFAQSAQLTQKSELPSQPVHIEQFNTNPGIYMEDISTLHMVNNLWSIVIYYDLRTYYQQLNGFEQSLRNLTEVCNRTIVHKYYCNSIVTEIEHKIRKLQQNNILLHKRNGNHLVKTRERRAPLEIIGAMQHTLFGVLDQAYADQIEEELRKIQGNENYLLSLAKNQTSITEVTTNILKKTTHDIEAQFEIFNQHIQSNLEEARQGLLNTKIAHTFTSMTTYLNILMGDYEAVQRQLIDLITDAHSGKMSPFLLTPQQLRNQLKHIREHIPTTLIIPGESNSEDLLEVYKIVTIKSRVTDENIIARIQLPLPEATTLQLFKLYPLPTEHNNEYVFIEPSSEFLATSLHRDSYYPLSQAELAECRQTKILGYLCQQKHPIYTTQALLSRCEMDLLNHKKPPRSVCKIKKTHPSHYWMQLHQPNRWIFVVHEETIINVVCGDRVIIKKLNKSGIIHLDSNCQVKHPTMSITAQTTFVNEERSSFLPLTNLSALLWDTDMQQSQTQKNEPIQLIHLDTKPLDDLTFSHGKKELSTLNSHHVHHYISTYVIAAIIIIIIGWITRPYLKRWLSPRRNTSNHSYAVPAVTPRTNLKRTPAATTSSPGPK